MSTFRTFIYGSCVSRDTFEYLRPDRYTLLNYVARQSLPSAFSRPGPGLDLGKVESKFQRRMLRGDAEGNLPALLTTPSSMDLVLWDLIDERLGMYVSGEGHVITRTVEGIAFGLYDNLVDWRLVAFGSDEHFALWTRALARFINRLDELGLLSRVILLAAPWAETMNDGSQSPASFGVDAATANKLFERYYQAARAAGITLAAASSTVRADRQHRWGPAPFHYSPTTYREIASAIEEAARSTRPRS